MRTRWTRELGLQTNPALEKGWKQLFYAVANQTISDRWSAVQLPTGAGKTQAIAMLCAQYEAHQHPGALLITRFKTEASELADQINGIARAQIAIASHSDDENGSDIIRRYPVLIITHSAFKQALKAIADGRILTSRMDEYREWNKGSRSWTIVDEMPEFVEPVSISLTAVAAMVTELECIDSEVCIPELPELKALLKSTTENGPNQQKNRLLKPDELGLLRDIGYQDFVERLWQIPERYFTSGEHHNLTGGEVRAGFQRTLSTLGKLSELKGVWKSSQRGVERLNGARLLFNHAGSSGVILDATASNDPIYELLGHRIKVLPRPEGIRDYSNVRLNLSYGHKVGKEHMCNNGREEWSRVLDALKHQLENGRKVLAISHKDNTPVLQTFGRFDGELSVAHWGALDGKNDWADHDAVVLFGLPFLDNVSPTNLFLGCQETLTDEWLSGEREYGDHADIQQALKDGFTIRSVVQAINRVRCRRVTDAQGGCDLTDVFVLMPGGAKSDKIVSAVHEQMPGMQVLKWEVVPNVAPARKQPTLYRLLQYLKQLKPGAYSKTEVIKAAGIAKRSFERLSKKLQDPSTQAYQRLAELKVGYACAIGVREAQFLVS